MIPYAVVQWIGDRLGRFHLYAFKRALKRGDIHEARHLSALIQTGNSQPCNEGEPCILDGGVLPITLPSYPPAGGNQKEVR